MVGICIMIAMLIAVALIEGHRSDFEPPVPLCKPRADRYTTHTKAGYKPPKNAKYGHQG